MKSVRSWPRSKLQATLALLAEEDEADLRRNPLKLIRHPKRGIIPLHPMPKQREFIDRFHAVQKVMGWDGPNRAGKSLAAAMVVIEMIAGWAIDDWPGLPWDLSHHPMGPVKRVGCITISREKSKDGQQRYLADRLPKSVLACKPWTEKTGFGEHPKLILRNGSTVDFLSDLQREQSLEQFQWDLAWIDEAIDEWVYQRVIARLADVGGKLIITSVAEKAWIHRVLRLHVLAPDSIEPAPDGLIDTVSTSTMWDNIYIDDQDIQRSIALWGGANSKEARMRVFGQYVHLEGVVFDCYDELLHVEDSYDPPAEWTRFERCDPGYRNPFAWSFIAVDPGGCRHVYDEIYERGRTVPEIAAMVKAKRRQHGYVEPEDPCTIDPAANAKRHWGREVVSIQAELDREGIRTIPGDAGPGSVDAGNQRLRALLVKGLLKLQRHCIWHRYEFQNYRYSDPDRATGEFAGDKERLIDANNHLISGLRYGETRGTWFTPERRDPPRGSPAWDMQEAERKKAAAAKTKRVWG